MPRDEKTVDSTSVPPSSAVSDPSSQHVPSTLSTRSSTSSILMEQAFRGGSTSRSSFSSEKPGQKEYTPSKFKPRPDNASKASSFEEKRPGYHMALAATASAGGVSKGIPLETVPELDLPSHLRSYFRRLGVIPADTPVPMTMLARLWALPGGVQAAVELAEELRGREVLRCVTLDDGSIWALVAAEHIEVILMLHADSQPAYHMELLDSYSNKGSVALRSIEDDGYILQNLAHHLLCAGRSQDLKELLTEPTWIEAKLHAYGVAAIVQDFRRYLGSKEDGDVKLLLQAFMLSLGCCMEHPLASMLRQQMLARLTAVVQAGGSPWLREWYEMQSSLVAGDEAMAAGTKLLHLMPRSASLEQAGGLHRMTLRGHSGPVLQVVLSPNGTDVITVSADGTAQVWDMNVGDCVMQLARDKPLTDVAVAPDGQLSVVACEDGNCCVWDLASGQVKYVLKGHVDKVNAVAIDRQGIRCVTAGDDGSVRVWCIFDGSCEQILQGHSSQAGQQAIVFDVAISADGCMAATVSDDFTCRVWDLDEECCMHVLEGHNGWVVSVEFIGTSMDLVTASHDNTARVWDGYKGMCNHVLEGHTGRLNKVTVDAGGQYAVTCSDDLTSRVWNLDTGECLSVLKGHEAWISDAAITRTGTHVVTVSGDATGILWNAKTGEIINQLEGHSDTIRSVLLTYRGRFAVTASDDGTVRVWDTTAPNLKRVDSHQGKIKQLRALPDGRHVVSAGEDGLARVWDVGNGAVVCTLSGHNGAAISFLRVSQDGSLAVTGSSDRCICLWTLPSGELKSQLPQQHGSRVKDMAFDSKCQYAAVLLFDSSVLVMDLMVGNCLQHLNKRGDRHLHAGGVNSLALTSDGQRLVTSSKSGTAWIWDVRSSTVVGVVQSSHDSITSTTLNKDQTMLATASYEKVVQLHRMSDGVCLASLKQPGVPSGPGVTFSPDGSLLAVVLDSNSVAVWDMLGTLNRPLVLPPHKGEITGLAFSPTSHLLATWGQDCTVRVWHCWSPVAGDQAAFFMADAAITSCCFVGGSQIAGAGAACAHVLVVGDVGGNVHFLDFPQELQMMGQSY